MSHGILMAALLIIGMALSSFKYSLDLNFATYRQAHTTTKAVVATLAEAAEITDDIKALGSKVQSLLALNSHLSACITWEWFNQESVFSKKASKIYKLHSTFLI